MILFVIKYSYGLLYDLHLIATYIGKGLLVSESQLKSKLCVQFFLNILIFLFSGC